MLTLVKEEVVKATARAWDALGHYEKVSPDEAQGWKGELGDAYLKRQPTTEEYDAHFGKAYGISRTELNRQALEGVPRDISILEVGTGNGFQLDILQSLGFGNLCGVDVNQASLDANSHTTYLADAIDLPFPDGSFDLVFTSGLLNTIPRTLRPKAESELARVTKRWLWGFEMWHWKEVVLRISDTPPIWLAPYPIQMFGFQLVRAKMLYSPTLHHMYLFKRGN